jgi:geranylgeranyl diphosphate synthase type I
VTVNVPQTLAQATRAGHDRDRLLSLVDDKMHAFLSGEQAHWLAVDHRSTVLIDAVTQLITAGGKRLRPAFCVSGYLAAGGDPSEDAIIPAAVALELLHACALIHDDVMDESALRRGTPTVHTRFAAEHGSEGWHGQSGRFGESAAILAGDLALVYADRLMAQAPPVAQAAWGELKSELIIGQWMDVLAAARFATDLELARWIAIVKSGRYTIHRPLVVGAIIAGRPELTPAFEAYGTAVGEAFQLRDDLLNVFGDENVTGKPGGLDLEQHKMTLLLTMAINRDERVGRLLPAARDDSSGLLRVLAESGVRDDVEKHIDALVERGCAAIADAPLSTEWHDELIIMAHKVAYRDK